MRTEFYEADPFSGGKGEHYLTVDTDYRFEKGDEVWLEVKGRRVKVRVTWVNVTVREDGELRREILGLKL